MLQLLLVLLLLLLGNSKLLHSSCTISRFMTALLLSWSMVMCSCRWLRAASLTLAAAMQLLQPQSAVLVLPVLLLMEQQGPRVVLWTFRLPRLQQLAQQQETLVALYQSQAAASRGKHQQAA